MKMDTSTRKLIRVAYKNPDLRGRLLPLIVKKKAASEGKIWKEVIDKILTDLKSEGSELTVDFIRDEILRSRSLGKSIEDACRAASQESAKKLLADEMTKKVNQLASDMGLKAKIKATDLKDRLKLAVPENSYYSIYRGVMRELEPAIVDYCFKKFKEI